MCEIGGGFSGDPLGIRGRRQIPWGFANEEHFFTTKTFFNLNFSSDLHVRDRRGIFWGSPESLGTAGKSPGICQPYSTRRLLDEI